MRLAIVGSTCARRDDVLPVIRRHLNDENVRVTAIVSGGAEGVDTFAEEVAAELGIPVVVCKPAKQSWPYFKARNILIAELCDQLVRIASERSKTYGSGWTLRYAGEILGKPCVEYVVP